MLGRAWDIDQRGIRRQRILRRIGHDDVRNRIRAAGHHRRFHGPSP